jgi:hypothetical protein
MCYESDFLLFMFGRNFCDTTVYLFASSVLHERKSCTLTRHVIVFTVLVPSTVPYRPGVSGMVMSPSTVRREIEVYGVLPYCTCAPAPQDLNDAECLRPALTSAAVLIVVHCSSGDGTT